MGKKYKKNEVKKSAQSHLDALEIQIRKVYHTDKSLAQRYLDISRRISRKFRLPLSKSLKRQHCKHCKELFVFGENSRVRLRGGMRIVYCNNCKKFTRTPYSSKSN